jgi:hypothetical protein
MADATDMTDSTEAADMGDLADGPERIVPRSTDPSVQPANVSISEAELRRQAAAPSSRVRAADLEPYVGLKYLSRLFKLIAVILILLLVSEIITGLVTNGLEGIPTLVGEVSRLVVLAGLLWGCGDLAILLIDMGHDLRATRILLGRQLAHNMDEQHSRIDPGMTPAEPEISAAVR